MKSKKFINGGLKSNINLISNEITDNKPSLNRVEEIKLNRNELRKDNIGVNFGEGINNSENIFIQNTVTNADEFVLEKDKLKKNKNSFENKSSKSPEELDKINKRKLQADVFEKYITETGIAKAFQLIFSELIIKKINTEDFYSYAAGRLRQLGRELQEKK